MLIGTITVGPANSQAPEDLSIRVVRPPSWTDRPPPLSLAASGKLREHGRECKHCFNIFLSHPHWDHIMGFPFFAPAYIPGNRIRIFGCHQTLEEALSTQHSAPWFPIDFC